MLSSRELFKVRLEKEDSEEERSFHITDAKVEFDLTCSNNYEVYVHKNGWEMSDKWDDNKKRRKIFLRRISFC